MAIGSTSSRPSEYMQGPGEEIYQGTETHLSEDNTHNLEHSLDHIKSDLGRLDDDGGQTLTALSHEFGGASLSSEVKSKASMMGGTPDLGDSHSRSTQLKDLLDSLLNAKRELQQGSSGSNHGMMDSIQDGINSIKQMLKHGHTQQSNTAPGTGSEAPAASSPSPSASGLSVSNTGGTPSPGMVPAGSASASGATTLGPNIPSALKPWAQTINQTSSETGVPAATIAAIVLQESGGTNGQTTTNPALGLPDSGLMQVDQATFQGLQSQYPQLAGKSVSDPATNIMAGALLMSQLMQQNNGNLSAALTAYNGNATPGYADQVQAKMSALQNGTLPVPGGFS